MKTLKNIRNIAKVAGSFIVASLFAGASVLGAFPAEILKDGHFDEDTLIVIGEQSMASDTLGAIDIATVLQREAKTCREEELDKTTVLGDTVSISESSDLLELYETLGEVKETLTEDDLEGLKGGDINTGEGTTDYEQYLRFEETDNSIQGGMVVYGEDEDDKIGDFLLFGDGDTMFEYEVEFSDGLESDIDDNMLEDLEDESLTMLGKEYTIVEADINTNKKDLKLTLLSGSISDDMGEGETKTYIFDGEDYKVEVLLISDDDDPEDREVKFKVNEELIDSMKEGDTETLDNGVLIGVRDILVNDAGDGPDIVEFFIGANKVELKDNYGDSDFSNGVEINDENIEDASVQIKGFQNEDEFEITTIKYRLEADANDGGDVYVEAGHSLSEYLDEPEGLLGGLDIFYEGLEDVGSTELELDSSGDDEYKLKFQNRDGLSYNIPLITTDGTFKYGDEDDDFIFQEPEASNSTNYFINEDDYFVLTDDNDETGVTRILRYESIDEDNKEIQFNDEGAGSLEYTYEGTPGDDARGEIIVGGNTFRFFVGNESNGFPIGVDLDHSGKIDGGEAFIVVKGGGLLDFDPINGTEATFTLRTLASEFDSPGNDEEIDFRVTDDGNELDVDLVKGVELYDRDNKDVESGMTRYGVRVEIEDDDNNNDADDVLIDYPHRQRGVDVKVAIGSTEVKDTKEICGIYEGKIGAVLDSEVEDIKAQNLILVGGPAINKITANVLGVAYPTYGTALNMSVGDSVTELAENGEKVAMVVYGFTAKDTRDAITSLVE